MGQFFSFASVLEQRIRKEILSEKTAFPSENPLNSSTDPKSPEGNSTLFREESVGFAWILGHTPRVKTGEPQRKLSRGKTAYGVKTRPRPPHKMTPAQTNAYCYFRSFAPEFEANFTRRDLQKTFRLIAKRVHPDLGGNAKDFIALKANLEVLAAIFPSK